MASKRPIQALHPATQSRDRDARIVATLERLGEVLRNLSWDAGRSMKVSHLHVQMLAFLRGRSKEGTRGVDLAARFHLSKPTVSVAVRSLEEHGAVRLVTSKSDSRAKVIVLTPKGRRMAEKATSHLDALVPLLERIPSDDRDALYASLFALLDAARTAGLVRVYSMCATCAHFGERNGRAYCALLRKPLAPHELRVDCPDHRAA